MVTDSTCEQTPIDTEAAGLESGIMSTIGNCDQCLRICFILRISFVNIFINEILTSLSVYLYVVSIYM